MMNFAKKIANKLLARTGPTYLQDRYPAENVGKHSYGGLQIFRFGDDTSFSVGKYCSIAAEVKLVLGGGHRPDWVTTYPFSDIDPEFSHIKGHPASKGDITIGNDVWIGREAMIMSGTTIGDGAVIAARSLVTKDVAPYEIVAGQPAEHLKFRFTEEQIARLLDIAWWNWPDEQVRSMVPLMLQPNIEAFLDEAEKL